MAAGRNPVQVDDAQASFWGAGLASLIEMAYNLPRYRVVEPPWLVYTNFDVVGKLPPGTRVAQVPSMLQAMLADRFGLTAHREQRGASGLLPRQGQAAPQDEAGQGERIGR